MRSSDIDTLNIVLLVILLAMEAWQLWYKPSAKKEKYQTPAPTRTTAPPPSLLAVKQAIASVQSGK